MTRNSGNIEEVAARMARRAELDAKREREAAALKKRGCRKPDILEWLAGKKRPDGWPMIGPAQKKAGETIRALYAEATSAIGVKAIDFTREVVDGGRGFAMPSVGKGADAIKTLARIERRVGWTHWVVLSRIVIGGESIQSVALDFEDNERHCANGCVTAKNRDHIGRLLREGLHIASIVLSNNFVQMPDYSKGVVSFHAMDARPSVADQPDEFRRVIEKTP